MGVVLVISKIGISKFAGETTEKEYRKEDRREIPEIRVSKGVS